MALNLKQLDDQFWRGEEAALLLVLLPLVTQSALEGAEAAAAVILAETSVGVDVAIMNEAAVAWARRATFELVSGITNTTRDILRRKVAEWSASGEPLSVLRTALEPVFGTVRSQMIASTETTRAFAEGNLTAWRESEVVESVEWNTVEDERVCPICVPLNGTTSPLPNPNFDGSGPPPAHVRCRCWLTPVVIPVEEAVI